MTVDLATRLLAAIDEVERLALDTPDGPWRIVVDPSTPWTHIQVVAGTEPEDWETVCSNGDGVGDNLPISIAYHLVAHQRETVLRRCEADRKLVSLHPQADATYAWLCDLCGDEGQTMDCTYPCDTIRLLAEGYGVRP